MQMIAREVGDDKGVSSAPLVILVHLKVNVTQ